MNTQQQKSSRILLIGDSCTDKYNFGICERMSPEAPVPILKTIRVENRPGMALNVLRHLENFCFNVDIYTNKENIVKERFVENTFMQHMLRVDHGEEQKVSQMSLRSIDEINISLYSCVVISDYDKGFVSHAVARKITRIANEADIPVFVDSKKSDLSCFHNSFIKINEKESKKLKKLPNEYELIVTLGKSGAVWNNKTFPTDDVQVFDVCGAGDSFFAGFINSYMLDRDIEKSIKFANKIAAISVKSFGTYVVNRDDV
tara:strand:- start:12057 stop:12833 length:777 start_codon:yes stop_codon:yes gene_type:complete